MSLPTPTSPTSLPSSFHSLSSSLQNSLLKFLKFSHHQRELSQRQLVQEWARWRESEMPDLDREQMGMQYSNLEIKSILDSLRDQFISECKQELKQQHYMQLELLRQLLVEAETQNVVLELEPLLAKVEDEEKIKELDQMDRVLHEPKPKKLNKLTPLKGLGSEKDVHEQLDSYKKENKNIRAKLKSTQNELEEMRQKMEQLRVQHGHEAESNAAEASQTQQSLQQQLRVLQKKYKDSQKELSQKVQKTQQFQNIQQMLKSKNEQLKELRQQLAKYEE